VRAEVDSPGQFPDEGRLEVCVELHRAQPGVSADAAALAQQSELEASLGAALRGQSVLDWRALGILRGQRCWLLGVDCLVLSDDGSVLDALSLAAKAALADVTLPELRLVAGVAGEAAADFELASGDSRLDVSAVPILVTVHRFGSRWLLDASAAEARAADSALWVAVGPLGDVGASGCVPGSAALSPQALIESLAAAGAAGVALQRTLASHLAKAPSLAVRPVS
jgi:exosome complex component RRP42